MKKALLVVALALCLVMAGSALALADYYPEDIASASDLAAALNDVESGSAEASGHQVTLLKDVDLGSQGLKLTGDTITLDLAGHELSGAVSGNCDGVFGAIIEVGQHARLTLTDSQGGGLIRNTTGDLDNDGKMDGDGIHVKKGQFTMESGAVEATCDAVAGLEDAILTIKGGTLYGQANGLNVTYGSEATVVGDAGISGENAGVQVLSGATATIKSGRIHGDLYGVAVGSLEDHATSDIEATIQGGTITGDYGIYMDSGELYLEGGKIYGDTAGLVIYNYCEDSLMELSGGTIEGGYYGLYLRDFGDFDFKALLTDRFSISGGQYGLYSYEGDVEFSEVKSFSLEAGDGSMTIEDLPIVGLYMYEAQLDLNDLAEGAIEGEDAAVVILNKERGLAIDLNGSTVVKGGDPDYVRVTDLGYVSAFTTDDELEIDRMTIGSGGPGEGGVIVLRGHNISEKVVFGEDEAAKQEQIMAAVGAKQDIPYINGYPDGTFRDAGLITRAEAATMFSRALGRAVVNDSTGAYTDLPASHWAQGPITYMTKEGVLQGYPDGTVRPSGNITRAEFVAMVCRLKNLAGASTGAPYTDISSHWAAGWVNDAYQQGWLADFPAGEFQPDQPITRLEAVLILNRVLGRYAMSYQSLGTGFSDVPVSHPYYDAIMRAASIMY